MTWLSGIRAGVAIGATLVGGGVAQAGDGPPATGAFGRTTLNRSPWAYSSMVGIDFAQNGQMMVWEKAGRVHFPLADGSDGNLVLDISDEVGSWVSQGMFGCVAHPEFPAVPQIFVLYTVDRHHLMNFGTSSYDPAVNEYEQASIARLTRYTLVQDGGGQWTADPASRRVLMGETPSTGIPVMTTAHTSGGLVFGTDGTLLVGSGDSYLNGAYDAQGQADGILRPDERVAAYRAQQVDSYSGKIFRIDPETGNGAPTNPWYDPAEPRTARSRVWALGARNPFRLELVPGTGSHFEADGDPGVIIFCDIGNNVAEEINVITGPGQNFGWPVYEGITAPGPFGARLNLAAPNPLFGVNGCDQEFFYFHELLHPAQADGGTPPPPLTNGCDPNELIPPSVLTFVHSPPALEYLRQTVEGPARVPAFDEDDLPTALVVGDEASPATGVGERGTCLIGGHFYTGDNYPSFFQGRYFVSDWEQGWMQAVEFGEDWDVQDIVTTFVPGTTPASVRDMTDMARHPITGDLYGVRYPLRIIQLEWRLSGNQSPEAAIASDVQYGPTPLVVQFDGADTTDPEQMSGDLMYRWDFGDGSPISNVQNPLHTFVTADGSPTAFEVTLEVEDDGGLIDEATMLVSVNNTPPEVTITSPLPTDTYSIAGVTPFTLDALVSDAEHTQGELSCEWETRLYHNTHYHIEVEDDSCSSASRATPLGCLEAADYWYGFILRVTDPTGLQTVQEVLVYPDCGNTPANDRCDTAEPLMQGVVTIGNALFATPDPVGDCVDLTSDAGVWYGFSGNGQHAKLSLDAVPSERSPLLSVFEGEDCNNITCVAQNDRACGLQPSASFVTTAGAVYQVLVQPDFGGEFELLLELAPIPCPCDINADGASDVVDLLGFLGAFYPANAVDPTPCTVRAADYNGDGVAEVQDLLNFLSCWFPATNTGACPE